MKRITLIISVIAVLIFSGCEAEMEENAIERIQKSLVNLETYSCTAYIVQKSNKGESNYEVTQQAKRSGEYRITVTSPEKVAGTITIFNGRSTFQYNPKVDGSLKIDIPHSQARNEILLTSFIKNYLTGKESTVQVMASEDAGFEKGEKFTVPEAKIPGTNPHMTTERLMIDNETFLPVKLVIYDENDNEKIVVTYKEIEYNVKLGEELFTITD